MNTTKNPESLRVGNTKRLWHVIRLMKSGTLLRGASLNKYEDKDIAKRGLKPKPANFNYSKTVNPKTYPKENTQ